MTRLDDLTTMASCACGNLRIIGSFERQIRWLWPYSMTGALCFPEFLQFAADVQTRANVVMYQYFHCACLGIAPYSGLTQWATVCCVKFRQALNHFYRKVKCLNWPIFFGRSMLKCYPIVLVATNHSRCPNGLWQSISSGKSCRHSC